MSSYIFKLEAKKKINKGTDVDQQLDHRPAEQMHQAICLYL